MRTLLLGLLFIGYSYSNAQVPTAQQPDSGFFNRIYKEQIQKLPTKNTLLKYTAGSIPDHLQDTLRKYDWVDLGSYLHVDKKFTVNYGIKPTQYNLWRLYDADTVVNFQYVQFKGNYELTHTNFNLAMQPVYAVKKVAGFWYIEFNYSHGTKEYLKIISFKNGILIYDTPMNGKTTDKKMFSRCVAMAVPKTFNWIKNEKP